MLGISQQDIADKAKVSVPTIKRLEAGDGPLKGTYETVSAVISVLEVAGIIFTNGETPGVKLNPGKKSKP